MEKQQKSNDGFWKALSVVLIIILGGISAFMIWQNQQPRHVYYEKPSNNSGDISELAAYSPGLDVDHESIYWIADLAEQALPFVVNVETIIRYDEGENEQVKDLMEEWHKNMPDFPNFDFKQFSPEDFEMPEDMPNGGEGSGFIIREDGYVVTNSHVVHGADEFQIRMNDGTKYDAELIGADTLKDIAVLKIKDGGQFPVATLGSSTETRIGEPVVAIGSPLGFDATVTAGIVSTTHRSYEDLGRRSDSRRPTSLIQTDAAINRGNSGGPLLNAEGEVIGVNQAIVRWEDGGMGGFGMDRVPVDGIGFAIPIDEVKDTIEQIVTHGKVVYPGISATITSLEDFLKREPGIEMEVEKGVYVQSLVIDGPADRAGIEAGDVILKIEETELDSADQLITLIQDYKVGDRVKLLVSRQGTDEKEEVIVVLGELDLSKFAER